MREIELVLCSPLDPGKELRLYYTLLDTSIARKYFACVRAVERLNLPVDERERFYNFPNSYRTGPWIVSELNRCIDIINGHSPGAIEMRAEPPLTQGLMNRLHHYFEVYRGGVLAPGKFYLSAPAVVRGALNEMNLLIHRHEDFARNERKVASGGRPNARAVITFVRCQRYPLSDEDYNHFSLRNVFGTISIDYCEVGKPIWDVFRDGDEVVGDGNIRPLRYFSAHATLRFGATESEDSYERRLARFWGWWDEHEKKLSALGFVKFDKRNSLGMIVVGNLNREKGAVAGLSEEKIVDIVGRYQCFKGLRAIEATQIEVPGEP